MLGKLRILAVNEVQHVVRLIYAVSSLYGWCMQGSSRYWLDELSNLPHLTLLSDKTRTPMHDRVGRAHSAQLY